jgi:Pectate lyase superfamily protein
MPCPPQVPISIIPPVSSGQGPLVWQNGNQITRLNKPLNPSWLVYDGSKTTWADGSVSAPVFLPNLQQVNQGIISFAVGLTPRGQLVAYANTTVDPDNAYVTATGSTTPRTLANRFADVVNVEDFGAVGDGFTDDTASIQAAANSINSSNSVLSGGILTFGKGKIYKITSTINLNAGTCIEGNKSTLVSYNCDAITYPPLPVIGGVRNINYVLAKISNLSFQSQSSNYSGYLNAKNNTYKAIQVVDAAKISVLDCVFYYYNYALWFSGCQQISIERCYFNQCWLGLRTFGGASYPNPTGPVTQSDGFYIGKNFFDQCVYPIYFDGFGANQGPTTITGNYFFAPVTSEANDGFFMRVGIIIEAVKGCTISDNTFDAYDVYNAYVANHSFNTFVPNTVGILIDYHTAGAYLTLSNILNPNVAQVGAGSQETSGVVISGNAIRSVGYGVLVKHGLGVTIIGNTMLDMTTCGITSNNTFNAVGSFNNYWYGWELLALAPAQYNIPYGSRVTISETNNNFGWRSNLPSSQGGYASGGSGNISVTYPYSYAANPFPQVTATGTPASGSTYNVVITTWSTTGFTAQRNINNGSANSNTGAYTIFWNVNGPLF